MTFSELQYSLNADENEFQTFFSYCESFIENSFQEMYQCINEKKNEDDKIDKSSEGAIVKIGKGIKAFFKKVVEFIKKTCENIKNFFTSKKTKDALDELDKACEKNPELKNAKIEVDDFNSIDRIYDEGVSKIDKEIKETRAGKLGNKNDTKDIVDETNDKAAKTKKITIGLGVAVASITAAVAIFEHKTKRDLEDIADDENAVGVDLDKGPEQAEEVLSGVRDKLALIHNGSARRSNIISNMFASVKKFLTGDTREESDNIHYTGQKLTKDEKKKLNTKDPDYVKELKHSTKITTPSREEMEELQNAKRVKKSKYGNWYRSAKFGKKGKKNDIENEDDDFDKDDSTELQESAYDEYLNEIFESVKNDYEEFTETVICEPEEYLDALEKELFS